MPGDEKKEKPEADEKEEAKPKAAPSRLAKYLLGSLVFLLIVAVTGAVAFAVSRFVIDKMSAGPVVPPSDEGPGRLRAGVEPKIYHCGGEPFTVILTDPEGRGGSSTLRLFVSLAVNPDARDPTAEEIMRELNRRTPFIRNAIYEVLQAQDPQAFTGPARAEAWGNLKAQIQKAVHDQLPAGYQVQHVLFDNPIFQAG